MNQEFIATNYPWFLKTYNSYPYPIQKADAVRYFLLYHYGGIYVDLDISCGRNISETLNVPAWIPKTEPMGFSNDVMSSMPKHPFFKQVIEALPSWNIWVLTNYPTVMISTGPLFLSIQAYIYNRNHKNNSNYPKLMVLPESVSKSIFNESGIPEDIFIIIGQEARGTLQMLIYSSVCMPID